MKRMLLTPLAIIVLAGLTGCRCLPCPWIPGCLGACGGGADAGCQSCSDDSCQSCGDAGCGAGRGGAEAFTPGPPTGAITYPYYTNRGPRDFLAENPPSIGP